MAAEEEEEPNPRPPLCSPKHGKLVLTLLIRDQHVDEQK